MIVLAASVAQRLRCVDAERPPEGVGRLDFERVDS